LRSAWCAARAAAKPGSAAPVLQHSTAALSARRREEKQEPRAPALPSDHAAFGYGVPTELLREGAHIEVIANDDGLVGAAFVGSILSTDPSRSNAAGKAGSMRHAANKLVVQYDSLLEEEGSDTKRSELVPKAQIRLRPPLAPAGFHGLLRVGDPLQLCLDDAWWDVQLTKIDAVATTPVAPPLFHVISLEYGAKHAVPASRLRPCWMWEGDRAAWRYNITAGSGTAPHVQTSELTDNRDALADQPTCHIFQFAPGVSRWRNAFYDHAAVALKATARGAADTSN